MFKMKALAASVSAALALGAATASAAPVTFFGEDPGGVVPNATNASNAFQAALVGVTTQNFEGFSGGGLASPTNVAFGADIATLTGTMQINTTPGAGRFAISGTNYLETRPGFTLTFSAPQAAFGFFASDIGDYGGQLSLSFDGGPGVLVPHQVGSGGSTNGHGIFFGFIDVANPFTSVAFINTNTGDAFGFDDFTIGRVENVRPTPEPGTLLLLGLGLMGVGFARMRRA